MMECTVEIHGIEASLNVIDWEWLSDDQDLADLLNSMLDPNGFSPSQDNPALDEAKRVIAALGGRIVEVVHGEAPKLKPGEVI